MWKEDQNLARNIKESNTISVNHPALSNYHAIDIQVPKQTCPQNFNYVPHIQIFNMHIWSMYVHKCATHKVLGINHVTRNTVQMTTIICQLLPTV